MGEFLRSLRAATLYGMKRMTDADSKSIGLAFRKRHNQKYLDELDKKFVNQVLLPKVYADGKKQIAAHRQEGKLLVLVSASTENYMRFVADTLGFDTVLCTPIEADGTIRRNCKGEKKTQRIKDWLAENGLTADFPSSFAYGDSKSDLPNAPPRRSSRAGESEKSAAGAGAGDEYDTLEMKAGTCFAYPVQRDEHASSL